MAIFHLSVQVIKRSEGRSVIAAAAYRAAERLINERLGVVHAFPSKHGVEHREIFAPKDAPRWVAERERLWNEVERAEKRHDAQLAREVRVALPKELTADEQLELLRGYIREQFVAHGMIADLAIHRDKTDNPHAHILVTLRGISPDGFGNKVRDWNRTELLIEWRERWGLACNRALALAGSKSRVTHLSHVARGLLTLPGIKIGLRRLKVAMERRGFVLDRLKRQEAIQFRNGEAIRKDPRVALQELTYHEAVFTRAEMRAYVVSHSVDAEQAKACEDAIMAHEQVVFAGLSRRREEVFTTQETLDHEQAMLATARTLNGAQDNAREIGVTQERLQTYGTKLGLSQEQTAALIHVVKDTGKLAVVEGYAGTGKSRMFDGARFVWEKQGKRVLGAALAGKAAEELGRSATLKDSRSLAAWEFAWKQGRDRLRKDDVLIIDEAGMVGTRQMRRVLDAAHKTGAKVVLAGDAEQLQAVEAGSPFHAIGDLVERKASLSLVRRQYAEWQRQASVDLAEGRTSIAVASYASRGCVHRFDKEDAAVKAMVVAWSEHERAGRGSQVALSYRRVQVPALNEALRAVRVDMGTVTEGRTVQTEHGPRVFGVGDRVCFTRNNSQLGVRNGSLGTVTGISLGEMSVRLDGDDRRVVAFQTSEWKHIDHGYAVSVHRSQGITVDRVHVLAAKAFDRHAAYVAMTRHRERLDLYASREEFGSADLGKMLSRKRQKRLALDYMAEHVLTQRIEAQRRAKDSPEPLQSVGGGSDSVLTEGPLKTVARQPVTLAASRAPTQESTLEPPLGSATDLTRAAQTGSPGSNHRSQELAAARALADAERVAAGRIMSVAAAFKIIPETAEARRVLHEATEARAFWRAASEKDATNRSLAARFGFGRKASERDPGSGKLMTSGEGLRFAQERVKLAAESYERLCGEPSVRDAARKHAAEHNQSIKEAKQSLEKLRTGYDVAKAERVGCTEQKSDEMQRSQAQEHELCGPEL